MSEAPELAHGEDNPDGPPPLENQTAKISTPDQTSIPDLLEPIPLNPTDPMKLAAATMVVVVLVLIAAVLIRRKTMNDVPALFAQIATDKSDYDAKVADQATKDAAAAQADSDAAAAKMKLLQTRDALIAAINQAYTPA